MCACFPEATELPHAFQEGSLLARKLSDVQIPAGPPTTYTPWQDRPHLQLKVASEIIGLSIASLYNFSDQGKLRLRELGGRTLVETESFKALIKTAKDWTPKNRGQEARAKRKEIARAALQG
jgi:hypothetical protein